MNNNSPGAHIIIRLLSFGAAAFLPEPLNWIVLAMLVAYAISTIDWGRWW